jgi:hypothetical protein
MSIRFLLISIALAVALAWTLPALAQDKGALNPKPLPPLADPANPRLPAKEVFGRAMTPVEAQARSIGFYARLSCRSEGAAGRWRILAGRPPVAQSHVGKSGDDFLP